MKKLLLSILALLFVFAIAIPQISEAHVLYLVEEEDIAEYSGFDFAFLFDALKDFNNISLILWTIAGLIIIFMLATQVRYFREKIRSVDERADSYGVFTPWMLRLGLGIALIGSGSASTLISPVLDGFTAFSLIQIFIGFLIMAGLFVVPAAMAALGIYVFALFTDWYIIGNLEFAMIALSLIVLDNEKPGLDHLLGFPKISPLRALQRYVPLILRVGIGTSMIFLALYEKIFNPHLSELVVTKFGLINVVPVSPEMWVLATGVIELAVGLALLVGLYTRAAAGVAFIVLSLSFFYFGEDVASHITLFGVLSVLFVTQGGALSLDKKIFKTNADFT